MTDASAQSEQVQLVQQLQQDNARLRAELEKIRASEARAAKGRKAVLKVGWSIFFPLFDRKKVVRSGMQLFSTASALSGPRDSWPSRDALVNDAREFALALLRFNIRRRTMMLLLSLIAFVIPGIQIWLVYQQNEIIQNQNKFFEIDVFDTTARGLTSGTLSSRQVTSALLAKVDLELLGGMVQGVFESDIGGALTEADLDARTRQMEGAAFRGYFISALAQQLRYRAGSTSVEELNRLAEPMFRAVIRDARFRVPTLLQISRSAATAEGTLMAEVSHYLTSLLSLMRAHYRLAHSLGQEPAYFATLQPLLERATSRRSRLLGEQSPFEDVFFGVGMEELLLDIAQKVEFGQPDPPLPTEAGAIGRLKQAGFEAMKAQMVSDRVNWSTFKKLAEVP